MISVLSELLREKKIVSSPKLFLKKRRWNQSLLIGAKHALIIVLSKVQCHVCKEYGHVVSHCKKRNFCVYCKNPVILLVNAGTDIKEMIY